MVHEKKKSGDPDYDDKVPADQHGARIVTAGDGREVLLTESNGPVDRVTGQHVNLDDPKGDEGDNRPAPGQVAEAPSEVQTYDVADTPVEKVSLEEAKGETTKNEVAGQSGDAEATPVRRGRSAK